PDGWLDAVLPFVESAHRARCDVETQT
ncbi:MAG: hypothetical protein QOH20_561, partial [Mycobacterium sp.]|nr:hypothetical protein [Mycobacterium sp.]